mmetsp:Transcript_34986/g.96771  ORF Transcript_34986/g.96771 Transcript_34986/m.96771 type:complete len:287 (-) Transcript_34986:110-970(-)
MPREVQRQARGDASNAIDHAEGNAEGTRVDVRLRGNPGLHVKEAETKADCDGEKEAHVSESGVADGFLDGCPRCLCPVLEVRADEVFARLENGRHDRPARCKENETVRQVVLDEFFRHGFDGGEDGGLDRDPQRQTDLNSSGHLSEIFLVERRHGSAAADHVEERRREAREQVAQLETAECRKPGWKSRAPSKLQTHGEDPDDGADDHRRRRAQSVVEDPGEKREGARAEVEVRVEHVTLGRGQAVVVVKVVDDDTEHKDHSVLQDTEDASGEEDHATATVEWPEA